MQCTHRRTTEVVMRLLAIIALITFTSPARGEEPQHTIPKEPEVLGIGYIAEVCKFSFADPVAQTACEVHIHMEIRAETSLRITELEEKTDFLFEVADRHKARADELEARIVALETPKKKGKK